jgi:phenylacetic acid degradation operon negative regulatory protein
MVVDRKPMTARSVVASTLLGVEPPRLTTRILVRSGELFGIAEGTTRVALSRMVAAGELRPDDDGYRLAGRLLDRQARQTASRRAVTEEWDGTWELAIVRAGGARRAADRASLRHALADLRLAELREGVWLRPANLPADRSPEARALAAGQCLSGRHADLDPPPDPAALWDLDGWADDARALQAELTELLPRFEAHDTGALGVGFVASAAVLRLLQRDPLLPRALRPASWPGDDLRRAYDRYDAAYRAVWTDWFRRQR